ncbi:MAG: aspartate carbamoyltransferase [Candidatus Thalassarchaeaceae archaeon]|jgi:aspartate carbamoyltransferase catalytic subunit|nr:aspartate carbamoyltransferase [Candidatus Thalassarchaeaceae archaeon]
MADDLITMDDLTNEEIEALLNDAEKLLPVAKGDVYLPLLQGKLLGNMFFEPSTRTRMSFETAMKRLGGNVVNLGALASSSVTKGETLFDTMKMVDGYCDVAVLRHPRQGAAQYAADACEIPIMNGGDGAGHHPTQTMLDLFTIRQAHGRLDLNVIMVGDLRYGRTVHSLSHALSRFGANLTFIAPSSLSMPEEIIEDLQKSGANITVSEDLLSNLPTADVIYMTRIQKERFPDEDEYLKVAGIYKLSRNNLKDVKETMIIMHPLPRIDEIHPNVDNTPHARYFDQAFNGVVARMALLCRVFGVSVPKEVGK